MRLFTRAIGNGPDIVVLHGGPGASHSSLLPEFDALARGRRLRYYDQRGCGRSTVAYDAPLGWREHVADLDALLGIWRLAPATVVGYSWGALLALLHAVTHPERTARLVLVAPAPLSSDERAEFERRLAARGRHPWIVEQRRGLERSGLRRRDPAAFRQLAFHLSVAPYFKDPRRADRVAPFVVAQRVREAVWRSLGTYDLSRAVTALSVDALVVHGRHDPIPIASAERIATALGARFEILDDAGHVPFVEESNRFISLLDGFLPRSDA